MLGNDLKEIPDDLALFLAGLVLSPQEWIHRRVEHVSYLDPATVSRRISVDFQVPSTAPKQLYLPIALLAKGKLTNFDLRDARGSSLPMLTAEENSSISASLLVAVAGYYAGAQVASAVREHIASLVSTSEPSERDRAWSRIFQEDTAKGGKLQSRPAFLALAHDLAMNFVLYLPTTSGEIGNRRIVKLSFDASRPRLEPRRGGLLARLGWEAVGDGFDVPLVGYGHSYHFELEAPPEMEITAGIFSAKREGPKGSEDVSDLADACPCRRAHFNLSRADRQPGQVLATFRLQRTDLISGVALLTVVNVAALIFVMLRLHQFQEQKADAAIPALLALPGVLIGYVTRPSQHPVLAGFLSALRTAAMVSALTAFAAGLVLVAGYPESTLEWILRGLLAVAAASSSVPVGSYLARLRAV